MKTRHSKLIVTPPNWQSGGAESLLKPWQISYYFFDDNNLKGKQIRIKGMNYATTLQDRRSITKELIANEIKLLSSGYNPITKTRGSDQSQSITENTYFIQALKNANESISVEHHTRLDISSRRDVVRLLDKCVTVDKISPFRYNRTKAYLSILFTYLEEHEVIEFNFVKGIKSKKKTKNIRQVITTTERERLYVLEDLNYPFYRFLQIFFHSGSRISELLRLQCKDVSSGQFKVMILKGSYRSEALKPIVDEVSKYWQELAGDPDHYVFSEGLKPGPNKIRRDQVTRRFKVHCKEGLGIKSDLYTLKHAHLRDIAEKIGIEQAQTLASHRSQATTEVYTGKIMEDLKGLKLSL